MFLISTAFAWISLLSLHLLCPGLPLSDLSIACHLDWDEVDAKENSNDVAQTLAVDSSLSYVCG